MLKSVEGEFAKKYSPVEVSDKSFHLDNSNLLISIEIKNSKKICHDLFWISAREHLEDVHELDEVDVVVAVGVVEAEEVTLQLFNIATWHCLQNHLPVRCDCQKKKRYFLGIFPKRGGGSPHFPKLFV